METKAHNSCVVCKETSEQVALHYTRMLCNGCRAFFKRTVQGKVKVSECKSQGQCVIDPNTRKLCKACRFEACQRAGVDSSKVQQQKDEYLETISDDQRLHHNIGLHLDGPQHLNPQSSYMSHASLPFYDGSQGIFAMQQATNLNVPSFVFNQNCNIQVPNPYALGNSRSELQPANMSASGSILPAAYTKIENPRTYIPSHNMHSHNAVGISDASLYMGMARNLSIGGQCYLYNSAQANIDAQRAHQAIFPQYLSSPQNVDHLQQIFQTSFNNGSALSQTGRNTVSHVLNGVSRRETFSSIATSSSEASDNGHDEMSSYRYSRCSTQFAETGIKHEISIPDREFVSYKENQASDALLSVCKRSQELNKQDEPASSCFDVTDQNSTGKKRSLVQPSEKSNAFMIDMLLKSSAQQREQKTVDECSHLISKYDHTFNSLTSEIFNQQALSGRLPLDHDEYRKYKTISLSVTSHHIQARTTPSPSIDISSDDPHVYQVRHSTPKQNHGESTLDDALEVMNHMNHTNHTDENTNGLEKFSKAGHNKQELNKQSEDTNVKSFSRGQQKRKKLKVDYATDTVSKSIHVQNLNKTGSVNDMDSGLGSSVHVSSREPHKIVKRRSVKKHTESQINYTDENFTTTPTKKKRVWQTSKEEKHEEESNRKKAFCSAFSPTTCVSELYREKDRLKELSDNSQISSTDTRNQSRESRVLFASSTELSSEDEATSLKSRLSPNLTSTPITQGEDDSFRHFLKIVCAFAEYCRRDERGTTYSYNMIKNEQDSEFRSLDGSGCERFNRLKRQENHAVGCQENHDERLLKVELLQKELMRKVRYLDSYTMSEFKTDVCMLSSLVQGCNEKSFNS